MYASNYYMLRFPFIVENLWIKKIANNYIVKILTLWMLGLKNRNFPLKHKGKCDTFLRFQCLYETLKCYDSVKANLNTMDKLESS